ncbi:MAG: pentapeptide repeat-containing protein [Mojavia pulchra JT2-VF2]|jgi:uncharacterized protein YjbI with pentapeptide repeats|uniref:Pentapeptide repeat-containing protein n=1 Tax=Mojavia pulchra JT2-VF2 TaxID=287848 RepID=A0A951UHS5_9NOST|nr:pentapeptide repeat-containing protein [Mojavia pulchra JT2-VF2]
MIKDWFIKQKLLIGIVVTAIGATLIIAKLYPFEGVGEWTGFGESLNKSKSIERTIRDGIVISIRETETENLESAKTFWDWLGLASTLAIPIVLLQFERREQRRADKQAEAQKAIAVNNLHEEILKVYIDRMSELLLDKNLKTLKLDDPLRDTALDVARARTLSVLRRLDKDSDRKGSVIQFLIDAELASELNLSGVDLKDADLRSANLIGTNLRNANLKSAILKDANLRGANLKDANLRSANLKDANLNNTILNFTYLKDANLIGANLIGANLIGANLIGANLTSANLTGAYLKDAKLEHANLKDAKLEYANLKDAKLEYANLKDANLKDAKLTGANLTGADLSHAKYISIDQIKFAENWDKAIYDKDFRAKLGSPVQDAK